MELKQIFPSAQNGSSTLHYEEQAQEKTVVEWVAMGSRILLVCHSIIRNTEGLQSEQAFDELCKIIVLKVIKDEQREREIASLSKDIRIKSETLRHVLSELDKIDAEIFRHTKGAIFEDFLSNLYRNGLSEYLTPPNVVDYMVSVLAPQNGERICDPCCGSGRFLIKSYEYVKQTTPKPELKLLGIDISRRIIELAKMNMFMNNIKHFDLVPHDGLLYDDSYSYADNMFDVVFASPPFGVKVEHEWISERYNSKSNRVDILLIERCLNILKPSGRMGIVLSEGVLFSSANKQIHKFIESQAKILQIASLPKGTFPNMGIKASILFFQKFSLEEKNAYAFVAQNSREDIKKHLLSNTKLNYDLFYADITDVGNTKRGYVSENNQLLLLAKEYQNVIKTGSLGYSTLLKQIDYAQIINWSHRPAPSPAGPSRRC